MVHLLSRNASLHLNESVLRLALVKNQNNFSQMVRNLVKKNPLIMIKNPKKSPRENL